MTEHDIDPGQGMATERSRCMRAVFRVVQAFPDASASSQTPPYYRQWVPVMVHPSVPYEYAHGLPWRREEPTDI